MRKLGFTVLSFALMVSTLAAQSAAPAPQKRKVAVMDFGYATVKKEVAAIFGTDQDIGKGIADVLVMQLVNGGDYRVIERTQLDKILAEQNLSNSDRADPATAAKIGGVLGVDAIIIGDITTFGNDDKHVGAGGGGGTWWGKGGFGGLGMDTHKAVVEITARVVDVNTAEILASTSGHGEAQRKGATMAGGGSSGWWNGGGGKVDFGSSNFQQTIIGQASKAAVTELATNLDDKAASLPPPTAKPVAAAAPISGLVADASNEGHHHQCRQSGWSQGRREAGHSAGRSGSERSDHRQAAAFHRRSSGRTDDHQRRCVLSRRHIQRRWHAESRG